MCLKLTKRRALKSCYCHHRLQWRNVTFVFCVLASASGFHWLNGRDRSFIRCPAVSSKLTRGDGVAYSTCMYANYVSAESLQSVHLSANFCWHSIPIIICIMSRPCVQANFHSAAPRRIIARLVLRVSERRRRQNNNRKFYNRYEPLLPCVLQVDNYSSEYCAVVPVAAIDSRQLVVNADRWCQLLLMLLTRESSWWWWWLGDVILANPRTPALGYLSIRQANYTRRRRGSWLVVIWRRPLAVTWSGDAARRLLQYRNCRLLPVVVVTQSSAAEARRRHVIGWRLATIIISLLLLLFSHMIAVNWCSVEFFIFHRLRDLDAFFLDSWRRAENE